MTFINFFLYLQPFLVCICCVFILKLQREIDFSNEMNLQSRRFMEEFSTRNQDPVGSETYGRRLTTSSTANCSAVINQAVIPVGTVLDFIGSQPPPGFFLCDGSAVSRTKYITLFNLIGIAYGEGDKITTFNLPDFRGRNSIGAGSGVGLSPRPLGQKGGNETHTLMTSELPSHTHTDSGHTHGITDNGHSHVQQTPTNCCNGNPANYFTTGTGQTGYGATTNGFTQASFTGITGTSAGYTSLQASGGGKPHSIVQPFLAVNKIIKY
jgi:microcystin-dependent protein